MALNASSSQSVITTVQGAFTVVTALHLAELHLPKQAHIFDFQVFDYIVVGAGTAGCVVAKRLAEDNKSTVLLVEAGANPQIQSNIASLMLYIKSSEEAWNFTIQDLGPSQQSRKHSKDDMSLGRVLGGSSSVGYLLYTPGSKHDYNNWAKLVNNSIWNWKNVLPYLKKSQRLEDAQLSSTDGEYFGKNGNIGLTVPRTVGNISNVTYFNGFKELGYNIVPSVNGNISLGYSSGIFTISNNIRQSTAVAYLATKEKHPNLYVLKNSLVEKVLFDTNKTATGVKVYTDDKRYLFLRARKEIILSAGVVNTPKLLMLSGIGPKKHLCKHRIHTISNLPVGEGLQDHLAVPLVFNMTKVIVPYRPFDPNLFPATVLTGYVALNKSNDYPDYQTINYVNYPKGNIKYCTFTYNYNDTICDNQMQTDTNTETMYTIIHKQKFKSRGQILLKIDYYKDDPLVYSGEYSVKEDLDHFAKLVLDFMRILKTKAFKKLGAVLKDPKLCACGKFDVNDLEYWKCYVLYMTTSQHQYAGTCSMGKVVDPYLKVYGVNHLRIADASVMPNPTAGGTLGPTIMIGEKAAAMIKKDHKSK